MVVTVISDKTRAVLREYGYESFQEHQPILITGSSAAYDLSSPEIWSLDLSSTAADNGTTVIKPNDRTNSEAGRYILKFKINTAGDPGRSINNATVGLTRAQLNTSYPNVPVGHMVLCPDILLGGAIYVKTTENGTNDRWQTISAPPTL